MDTQPPFVQARPVALAYARPATPPNPLLLLEADRRTVWMNLLLVLIVGVIAPSLPTYLMWMEDEQAAIGKIGLPEIALTWVRFFVIAAMAGYFVLRGDVRVRSLGLTARRWTVQLCWSPLIVVLMYMAMFAIGMTVLAGNGWPPDPTEIDRRFEFAEAMPTESIPVTIVLLVAVASYEELLFRGLLLTLLRRVSGSWIIAVAISSAMFGLLHFHQGTMAIVQITGLAVVLSLAFIGTRSLLAVVVAHFVFDFVQFQVVWFLVNGGW